VVQDNGRSKLTLEMIVLFGNILNDQAAFLFASHVERPRKGGQPKLISVSAWLANRAQRSSSDEIEQRQKSKGLHSHAGTSEPCLILRIVGVPNVIWNVRSVLIVHELSPFKTDIADSGRPKCHLELLLFSICIPTLQADLTVKDKFYIDLRHFIQMVPDNQVLGDFNAKVVEKFRSLEKNTRQAWYWKQ
ncbi:hypothetical protein LOAG_09823, partial [Loa loa]